MSPALRFFSFTNRPPALGQHVALAAVPVRVPEPPDFAADVLEVSSTPLQVLPLCSGKCFSACCLGMTRRFSFPTSRGVTAFSKSCSRALEARSDPNGPSGPLSARERRLPLESNP
ncbi:hypothetical protein M0R45_021930 [Rubus argutus]|uniref:Secreted protein n=1 Tax=Rubus argutus TaxID=59490 RepID=A0AAW1XCX2_RUBAR